VVSLVGVIMSGQKKCFFPWCGVEKLCIDCAQAYKLIESEKIDALLADFRQAVKRLEKKDAPAGL
jgi:hypothetical protein